MHGAVVQVATTEVVEEGGEGGEEEVEGADMKTKGMTETVCVCVCGRK